MNRSPPPCFACGKPYGDQPDECPGLGCPVAERKFQEEIAYAKRGVRRAIWYTTLVTIVAWVVMIMAVHSLHWREILVLCVGAFFAQTAGFWGGLASGHRPAMIADSQIQRGSIR